MTNFVLPVLAALALAQPALAADQPADATARSGCAQAVRAEGADASRQRSDADIDGSGACRLVDGQIRKASRTNTGVSTAGTGSGDEATPPRHQFGQGGATHALRASVDAGAVGQAASGIRGGTDAWGVGDGADMFGRQSEWHPWEDPQPGHVAGATLEQFGNVMPATGEAAIPSIPSTPLTSRTSGEAGDLAGTGPALAVPEPATWAMLVGGLAILMCRRFRRS